MIYETMDIPSSSDIEKKNITLPSSDPVIYRVLTSQDNVTTESERVGVITENIQLAKELYLESVFQKAPTQGFYCPHCRTCIQRVLILDKAKVDSERFTCATCFSFLIPIGEIFKTNQLFIKFSTYSVIWAQALNYSSTFFNR